MHRITWSVDAIQPLSSVIVKRTHELRTVVAEMKAIFADISSYVAAECLNLKQQRQTEPLLKWLPSISWLVISWNIFYHGKENYLSWLGFTCISVMDLPFLCTVSHPALLWEVSKDVWSNCHGMMYNIASDQGTHLIATNVQQLAYDHGIHCFHLILHHS